LKSDSLTFPNTNPKTQTVALYLVFWEKATKELRPNMRADYGINVNLCVKKSGGEKLASAHERSSIVRA
jgi:hypothetical protein